MLNIKLHEQHVFVLWEKTEAEIVSWPQDKETTIIGANCRPKHCVQPHQ